MFQQRAAAGMREPAEAGRTGCRSNSGGKADGVIDDEQFRSGFRGQFCELFGHRMVLRHEQLDAFGHPGEQFGWLGFVNQNGAAVASLDRAFDGIRVA